MNQYVNKYLLLLTPLSLSLSLSSYRVLVGKAKENKLFRKQAEVDV
jgi:hypothetical protein